MLKNGKYDSASTKMINEKYQELLQENFEANSAEFWGGVSQMLSGILLDFASVAAETGGLALAPETGGASFIAGTTAAEVALDAGNALIFSGVVSVGSAISKTGGANAEIQVNYSSNYDSWKANRPTSRTISGRGGKLIEARVGNRKVKLRVDWEPTSGPNGDGVFQVQSGSGKSGYGVNEHIEVNNIYNKNSVWDWINTNPQLKNLNKTDKEEIFNRIWKTYQNNY